MDQGHTDDGQGLSLPSYIWNEGNQICRTVVNSSESFILNCFTGVVY